MHSLGRLFEHVFLLPVVCFILETTDFLLHFSVQLLSYLIMDVITVCFEVLFQDWNAEEINTFSLEF